MVAKFGGVVRGVMGAGRNWRKAWAEKERLPIAFSSL